MKRLQEFSIVFNNPRSVYSSGQCLTGYVRVTLNKPMKMRGISLNVVGRAKVHFHKGSGKHREDFRSNEIYFDRTFLLHGTGRESILPAADYFYPFEFVLRSDLPSTFTGEHGYVRYMARAWIDRPWRCNDVTKETFTVLGCLDPNTLPESWKIPYVRTIQKTVSSVFSAPGNVEVALSINKRCFVPGEIIYVNCVISNRTKSTLTTRCALKQYYEFLAQSTSICSTEEMIAKYDKTYVASIEGGRIQKRHTDVWSNVPLVIPDLKPTGLGGNCSIINIRYVVKFYVGSVCKLEVPIIIGTTPTQDSSNLTTSHSQRSSTTAPLTVTASDMSDLSEPLLLPTYEEYVIRRLDVQD